MDDIRTKRLFDFFGEKPSENLIFNFGSDNPQAIENILKSGRYKFCFIDSFVDMVCKIASKTYIIFIKIVHILKNCSILPDVIKSKATPLISFKSVKIFRL